MIQDIPSDCKSPPTESLLGSALDLAAHGLRIVPLYHIVNGVCSCKLGAKCGRSAGKHPRLGKWPTVASTEVDVINRWWKKYPEANVGLVAGPESGVWQLDTDGDEGIADLATLEAQNSPLPRTPCFQTGGDGVQHLFKWPSDGTVITTGSKVEKRPIDTRGQGGQSVAPPSVSAKGPYRWLVSLQDAPIVEAPPWLIDWLRLNGRAEGGPHTGNGKTHSPMKMVMKATRTWTIEERAVAYLGKCPPSISGQSGHDDLFRAARALVWGFKLDKDVALRLLKDSFNPRCVPEWSPKELLHKVEEADSVSYRKPRGYLLDRDQNKGASDPPPDGTSAAPAPSGEGWQIIKAHLLSHLGPTFRRGNAVHSSTLGRIVPAHEATYAPSPELINLLGRATDSPKNENGMVQRGRLPEFFGRWCRVAWVSLLEDLPEEESACKVDVTARDTFRARVAQLLWSHVTLGETYREGDREFTRTERRPLILWATRFAKPGGWQDVRGYQIWVRQDGHGAPELSLDHLLTGQVPGFRDLQDYGQKRFARLARVYEVGESSDDTRVQGRRLIRLYQAFVDELLDMPDDGASADSSADSSADFSESATEKPSGGNLCLPIPPNRHTNRQTNRQSEPLEEQGDTTDLPICQSSRTHTHAPACVDTDQHIGNGRVDAQDT